MVTDNAAQEHIAVEEEEVIVMNWQMALIPMDPKIMDPLDRGMVLSTNSVTY
jgi:hypothetical protein